MDHLEWLHIKDVYVVKADEERAIAGHVADLLRQ